MSILTDIGGTIEKLGYDLNLPELGISEVLGVSTPEYQKDPVLEFPVGEGLDATTLGYTPLNQLPTSTTTPTTDFIGPTAPTTTTAPAPTAPNQPSPDDLWQQVLATTYPGWDPTSAYADWTAKGKPLPQAQSVNTGPTLEELEAQLTSQLQDVYAPAEGVLTEQEKLLREAQPGATSAIETQFGLREGEQAGDLASAQAGLNVSERGITRGKEDVLASSRRLYDELRRGYRQRFGGSSSAGEASNTLLGLEQQRQMGQTHRTFQDNMFKLNETRAEVQRSYQQNTAQLKFQRDEALRKSKDTFNSQLLSIMSDKASIESAKAERKLDALTAYRDSIVKAQQTQQEFQDRLDYQREVMDMEYNYDLKLLSARDTYKTPSQPTSAYGISGDYRYNKYTGEVTPISQAVGQIGEEEENIDWGA